MSKTTPVTLDERVDALLSVMADGKPRTRKQLISDSGLYPSDFTRDTIKKLRRAAEKQGQCIPWTQNGRPWILIDEDANEVVPAESFAFNQVKGTQNSQRRMLRFVEQNSKTLNEESRKVYEMRIKESNQTIDQIMNLFGSLQEQQKELLNIARSD